MRVMSDHPGKWREIRDRRARHRGVCEERDQEVPQLGEDNTSRSFDKARTSSGRLRELGETRARAVREVGETAPVLTRELSWPNIESTQRSDDGPADPSSTIRRSPLSTQFCDWLEVAEWFDSRGPKKTGEWLGVPRRAISQLNSPIDMTLLRGFAQKTRLEPSDPLYAFMKMAGETTCARPAYVRIYPTGPVAARARACVEAP